MEFNLLKSIEVFILVFFVQVANLFPFPKTQGSFTDSNIDENAYLVVPNFHFQHIGEKEGLSQERILCILQDRTGYLWLGTDEGLVRYDGYLFKTFVHSPNDSASLSNNLVNCLFEDSRGWLWIGTENGLNYFNPDTESFVAVQTIPKIYRRVNSNSIYSICEDSSGNIWTATSIGISRLQISKTNEALSHNANHNPTANQIKISHFIPDSQNPDNPANIIYSFLIDHNYNFWIGSATGLMRLVPSPNTFSHSPTADIEFKFEKIYNQLDNENALLKNLILSIKEDINHNIRLKTSNGLVRFQSLKTSPIQTATISNYKTFIYDKFLYRIGAFLEVDYRSHRQFWINLKDEGFTIFDKQSESFFNIQSEGASKSSSAIPFFINTIYKDRNGIFWFGTETGGLFKYDPASTRFSNYNPKLEPFISNPLIDLRFVFEDSHGILWFANQGVYRADRFSGKVLSSYWTDRKTPYWTFKNKIEEDGLGNIWLGSEFGGLYRYNQNEHQMKPMLNFTLNGEDTLVALKEEKIQAQFPHQIERVKMMFDPKTYINENITALTRDQYGNIWTGAWVDLFSDLQHTKIKKSFFTITHIDVFAQKIYSYKLNNALMNNFTRSKHFIYSIYVETPSLLWLGTSFGLLRFEPHSGAIKNFKVDLRDQKSLSSNQVHAVTPDKNNPHHYLWIGTDGGGLCRFDKKSETFKRYIDKNGLPGNTVSSILVDHHGNLWLGTDKGLSNAVIDPATSDIVHFYNYDRSDGISDDDFSFFYGQNAHQNRKGEMFFAGAKGITIFNPDSIKQTLPPPSIIASAFYLNFKSADFGEPGSPLRAPISRLKRIDLSYEENSFAIELATLNFQDPNKNRFAYKLEGYQDDWIFPGNQRRAVFTQVPPGKYTFRAKAATNHGVWNDSGLTLFINILPPWYQTWWAYLIFASIFLSLLYTVRRYELNRREYRLQANLQKIETERLIETDRIKSRFFTNISHEFRTPLALIKGPVEQELENCQSGSTRRRMNMVMRNVNRLLHLIGQLLDLTALETKHMELRADCVDLVTYVQGITMGFASWAERKNISLKIYSKIESIEVYFDRDLMEKILNNLLSNAIKFTPGGGKVEVTIQKGQDGHSVQLIIKDNGIGISEENLSHIFDRFYQVDASSTREHEGTGIGLALVKELVELHRGRIEVESKQGVGTTFTLTLPLGKEHLQPDEIMVSVTESRRVHKVSVDEFNFIHDDGIEETITNPVSSKEVPLLLIVEDHADFRHFIRDILKDDFRILEADDGQEGWEKALHKIPDLIISDVMMPKMNGYELCDKLKKDDRTCHIPVILLTAKAAAEDRLEGLHFGADDYLSKPFDSKELLSRIQNLITQRRKLQAYYQQHILLKTSNVPITSSDEKFLEKALDIVEENIENEQFSVEDLAKEVGMSRSQLHRKINALTDKSATHFIRSVRLQHAAELLKANAGNVTEIAYKVGFGSQSYFTKCFVEYFGCSPSEYKKRHR